MLILKGIIIGIGKIIPGVSGSMLAITLGIYPKIINALNNFFSDIKNNFKLLSKLAIGVIISIVLFSRIILKSLDNYYIITMFFFIGLIIGGFGDIEKNIEGKKLKVFSISLILVSLIGLISINNEVKVENDCLSFIYFIFIGFVDALTTVIPGISGTATLMMLGAYTTLIKCFSTAFDTYYLGDNLKILIPFGIGFIIGIILTAKLINYLFDKYKSNTYSCILGFGVATIILMFIKCLNSFYTVKDLIIAFVLLLSGFFATKKINLLFVVD